MSRDRSKKRLKNLINFRVDQSLESLEGRKVRRNSQRRLSIKQRNRKKAR